MNLTLETADIVSAKIEDIIVKHKSIQEEIKDAPKTYPLVRLKQLPVNFEGFFWKLKGQTMCAMRGDNLDFQVVIVTAVVSKYLCNMQAIRKFKITHLLSGLTISQERTDESIRLTKTINNTGSKITLNAHLIA